MKSRTLLITLLLIFLLATNAAALQTPLESVSRSTVAVHEKTELMLISYSAHLRVRPGFTTVSASMVIYNPTDTEISVMLGLPADLEGTLRRISDPSVLLEGQRPRINSLRDAGREILTLREIPRQWHTHTLRIGARENKVLDVSFTMDNSREQNGTEVVWMPLDFLTPWRAPIRNIQITADLGLLPAYVFEPNPNIPPDAYDESGRLTWRFQNVTALQDIRFFFRPIDQIALTYIENTETDRTVGQILSDYRMKKYDDVIHAIGLYLEEQPDSPVRQELTFLKALSHQGLYQMPQALALMEALEGNPGFGEMGSTIRNRIIYDRVQSMKNTEAEEDFSLYRYLQAVHNTIENNDAFAAWIQAEYSRLTPPPTPEPPPATPEPVPEPPADETSERLIKYVEIGPLKIPVEFVFLGGGVVLILILLMTRRKKSRKNLPYLFR